MLMMAITVRQTKCCMGVSSIQSRFKDLYFVKLIGNIWNVFAHGPSIVIYTIANCNKLRDGTQVHHVFVGPNQRQSFETQEMGAMGAGDLVAPWWRIHAVSINDG